MPRHKAAPAFLCNPTYSLMPLLMLNNKQLFLAITPIDLTYPLHTKKGALTDEREHK
jgi:hypothetical protein